jgi:DNA topoisomerase-3
VAPGELVSAGRVQTPTLALLVDREQEIRTFEPRDFWEVIATLSVAAGAWQAKWFDPAFKPNGDPAAPPASSRLRCWQHRSTAARWRRHQGPSQEQEGQGP